MRNDVNFKIHLESIFSHEVATEELEVAVETIKENMDSDFITVRGHRENGEVVFDTIFTMTEEELDSGGTWNYYSPEEVLALFKEALELRMVAKAYGY